MIWIDFTLIGLVFIFFVSGLLRGFTKEVFFISILDTGNLGELDV